MVDEALNLATEARDCPRALAGATVGIPCVYQLPGSQSLTLDPQTGEGVSVHSVSFFSLEQMLILNRRNRHT
jgi:hypothetical protein